MSFRGRLTDYIGDVKDSAVKYVPKVLTKEVVRFNELKAYYPDSVVKRNRYDPNKALYLMDVKYLRSPNPILKDIVPIVVTGWTPFKNKRYCPGKAFIGVFEESQIIRHKLRNNPEKVRQEIIGNGLRGVNITKTNDFRDLILALIRNYYYMCRSNSNGHKDNTVENLRFAKAHGLSKINELQNLIKVFVNQEFREYNMIR